MYTNIKKMRNLKINVEDEKLRRLLYDWQNDIYGKYLDSDMKDFHLLEKLLCHIGFEGTALMYPAEDISRPEEMYIKITQNDGTIDIERIIISYLIEDNVPVIILENRDKLYCVEVKKCLNCEKPFITLDGHPTVFVK